MRQLFLDQGTLVVKEVAQPLLRDDSVLVSVQYACISSITEIAAITQTSSSFFNNIPRKVRQVLASAANHTADKAADLIKNGLKSEVYSPGYSCSGSVIAVGKNVTHLRPGDLVACAGTGYAYYADLVCVPQHLVVRVKSKEFLKTASITTMGTVALHAVRRAQLQIAETVCIVGLGLLGQIMVQLAKKAGCYVIAIDVEPERIALARNCGADMALHAHQDEIKEQINLVTEYNGADVTIVAAACDTHEVMEQALAITRPRGRIVVAGHVNLDFNHELFYHKEIDLLVSSTDEIRHTLDHSCDPNDFSCSNNRWSEQRNMQAFVQLIESKALQIEPLIATEVTMETVEAAYRAIQEKKVLAVTLTYPALATKQPVVGKEPRRKNQNKTVEAFFIPATKDQMRVAIVGAGGFAQEKLLPIIAKIRSAKINAVVDTDIANSISVTKRFGAAKALTRQDELFEQDLADVVVIASPHKFHADQALAALQNGKAVLLEKPMVTSAAQLQQITDFVQANPNAPFCVDYNRSFSPFMTKIKTMLVKRHTPIMVQYRVNAGVISPSHWMYSTNGSGRIIGEACHIIDLFCFLTDAKPYAVSVEAVHASRKDIFPTDNFSAHISFDDGSVCSLLYTSLGHENVGAERMELFFDGKSIIMDDFVGLYGMGLPSWFSETVSVPDYGHEQLVTQFFASLKKETFVSPIPFERLATVAQVTLVIDQLACSGGGKKELAS